MFQGSLLVIIIMIDGSEKRNCEGGNSSQVCEERSKVRSAASVLKLFVFRKLNHFHLRDLVSHSLGSGPKQC